MKILEIVGLILLLPFIFSTLCTLVLGLTAAWCFFYKLLRELVGGRTSKPTKGKPLSTETENNIEEEKK